MDTPEPPPVPDPTTPTVTPTPRSRVFLWTLLFLLVCALAELGFVLTHSSESTYVLPTVTRPFFLAVDTSAGTVLSVNDQILITGRTFPNSTIALYSDTDDAIVESDGQGKFEGSVTVGVSGGTVGITAYGPAGEEITKTVAYTIAANGVLGQSTTAPGQVKKETGSATVSAKKLNVVVPTTVSATTVSAKKTQEDKLVKDFVANRTPPPKKETLSVTKLKDVVARESTESALQIPGLNIHKLDVVVVATGAANVSRSAVSGVITAISGSTITVSHIIHRDRTWTVLINAQTVITGKGLATGPATLAIGMRIAAVGQSTGEGLLAERIHIISGKAIGVFNRFPVATNSGQVSPTPIASPSAIPTETMTPMGIITPTSTATATPSP
jgi:hypothetical protein